MTQPQVVILAAGCGRRMLPETRSCHKSLLRVAGRAIIEWIIDALRARDITDIAIVTGYRAEELQAHLAQTYPDLPFNYIHNEHFAQTNNIHSLSLALDDLTIERDLLLIECDLVFEPKVLDRLLESPHPNVALIDRFQDGMDGTVVQIADGIITAVIPPHLQKADFDFRDKYKTLNIYRFCPEFCAGPFRKLLTYYSRVIDENQYYELVLGILIYLQRATIHAETLDGERWAEIDDPNDLQAARFVFDEAGRRDFLEGSFGGYWNYPVLDFRFLRNMYFPSDAVLAELRNGLPELVQNYGSGQKILNQKLAYFLDCNEAPLFALNGLSQAFPWLRDFFQNRSVLIPAPTFGEYPRIFPDAATYDDTVGFDLNALTASAQRHDVVVFVTPNNPTGSTLPTAWIQEFALSHPQKWLLVDESFLEFSEEQSLLELLKDTPLSNVVWLKSLSKTLGVPGVRLGALYSTHEELCAFVQRQIPIWNLNSIAEHFLKIVLKHRPALLESYRQSMADRESFAALLETLSVVKKVFRGGGNFLLVALHLPAEQSTNLVTALLEKQLIYVADVSQRFPDVLTYLRIAVRRPAENGYFATRLEAVTRELMERGLK